MAMNDIFALLRDAQGRPIFSPDPRLYATTPLEAMDAERAAATDPMMALYGDQLGGGASVAQPDFYQAMGGERPAPSPGIGTVRGPQGQRATRGVNAQGDADYLYEPAAGSGHRQADAEMAKMEGLIDQIRPRTKEEKMNDFLAQAFLGMAASPNNSFLGALAEGTNSAYGSQIKQNAAERDDMRDNARLRQGVYSYGQNERELESQDRYRQDMANRADKAAQSEDRREREWAANAIRDTDLKDVQQQLKDLEKNDDLSDKEKTAARSELLLERKGILKRMSDVRLGRLAPDVVGDAIEAADPGDMMDFSKLPTRK